MGSIYKRGDSPNWWIAFKDESGARRLISAETTDEGAARAKLEEIERLVETKKALGIVESGPMTVEKWGAHFVGLQKKKKLGTAGDDAQRLRDHVYPSIGKMALREVRTRHIQEVVDAATEKGLSSRTVHLVYGTMRLMFRAAVKRELIPGSPCVLNVKEGDLPKKKDKVPGWRARAIFSRSEIVALISDVRILEAHRVLWALVLLGGMRIGEACGRRWADIDDEFRPLAKMHIDSAWVTDRKELKAGGKTGVAREMPVHPALAAILARWRYGGGRDAWLARIDRPWRKKEDSADIIIPGPRGGFLSASTSWRWLQDELAMLGFRPRRQHDARRTFNSLCIEDGGRADIVKLALWGASQTVQGQYTSLTWEAICGEIAKLRIEPPSWAVATQSYADSKVSE